MTRMIFAMLTLAVLTMGLAGCHAEADIDTATNVGLVK